jgi:dolichyl-phosphate beta-glucosyltransferase
MKLSVLVPAYNEETRIAETLHSIDTYLKGQNYEYEIIVVVNGSRDHTFDVVKQLEGTMANARAVNYPEPGKGNAVKRGILEEAAGDIILFMDADDATPVSEFGKFVGFFEQGYDVVIGSREVNPELLKIKQSFKRRVLGHMSHWLTRVVLLPDVYDSQLGFKAFTNKAGKDIFASVKILTWAFDMEVLAIAQARGYKIKEVGVLWSEFGGGHVPLSAFAQSLIDLFRIKLKRLAGGYNK